MNDIYCSIRVKLKIDKGRYTKVQNLFDFYDI